MMNDLTGTQFSVLKFVSDPIRDEPINVGVVAQVDGKLQTRFMQSFSRLRNILQAEDIDSLATGVRFLQSSIDRSPNISLEELVTSYFGQFRFSPVFGALTEDPLEFLDDQFDLYVAVEEIAKKAAETEDRGRIRKQIGQQIAQVYGRSADYFALSKRRVKGATATHSFDYGFLNGTLTLLKAISFQTQPQYAVGEAKITAFSAIDTKEAHSNEAIEFAAVIAPPKDGEMAYQEAYNLLSKRMQVVRTNELSEFMRKLLAEKEIKPVPNEILQPAVA